MRQGCYDRNQLRRFHVDRCLTLLEIVEDKFPLKTHRLLIDPLSLEYSGIYVFYY